MLICVSRTDVRAVIGLHGRTLPVAAAIIMWAAAATAASANNSAEGGNYNLQTMHTHALFWTVCAASVAGWVLGIVKGFSSSADWFKQYWPTPNLLVVLVVDFFVFAVGGAYIGTGIFNPTGFVAALAAGITWPIAFAALTTKDARNQRPRRNPRRRVPTPNAGRKVAVGLKKRLVRRKKRVVRRRPQGGR